MERLKEDLFRKGGEETDWQLILNEGLRLEDHVWYEAAESGDPKKRVSESFGIGRVLEYRCYDARWRPQGKAMIEIVGHGDEGEETLKGIHITASDPYYEWYGGAKLGVGNCVYHLCSKAGKRCGFKLERGDGRELIHLSEWRLVNGGIMMAEDYGREAGLARVRDGVRRFIPHPVAPPGAGGAGLGAGLDLAVEKLRVPEPEDERPIAGGHRGEGGGEKRLGKKRVGEVLIEKASDYEVKHPPKKKRKKKKPREGDRMEKKKHSRGEKGVETDSSDDESSASSESFHAAPTRGGADLWKLSQRNPGKLLKSGMMELSRYLADRVGDSHEVPWHDRRVLAYVNQIMLTQGGGSGLGVRNQREAITLATCIDQLLSGNLGGLGDTLMQRLKALESAVHDQSWQSARHQELISPQNASLTSNEERDRAARTEIKMLKLRSSLMKTKGNK